MYQERTCTEQMEVFIEHITNPDDIVLNTAQMRDAIHVQKFRVASEILDLDDIVMQSAVKELASRKEDVSAAAVVAQPHPTAVMPPMASTSSSAPPRPRPRRLQELS